MSTSGPLGPGLLQPSRRCRWQQRRRSSGQSAAFGPLPPLAAGSAWGHGRPVAAPIQCPAHR
eukprot:9341238-Lingulodinium_polyedra.AAC.1